MLVKVVAVQARMGQPLSLEEKIHVFKERPDFVCLPEYCMLDDSVEDYHRAALRVAEYLEYLERLSDQLSTCLIAGTVVDSLDDRLYNTCYVINRGIRCARYRKRYPVPNEVRQGISPGADRLILEVDGVRIGILICGDVFQAALFDELYEAQTDLIFIPTTSPYRPADSISEKLARDNRYFVQGAKRAGAFIVKVCGVGRIFGHPLQGRSLVAAPWGVITRTEFTGENEKRLLKVTLDIDEMREFRLKLRQRKHRSLAP